MSKSNWHKIKHKTYDAEKEGFGNPDSWQHAFHTRLSSGLQADAEADSIKLGSVLSSCTTLPELLTTFRKLIKQVHSDVAPDTPENKIASQLLIKEYQECRMRLKQKP